MDHAPPPPFKLSRESRIRIDRDGYFWHDGARVEHAGLAQGLARWLAVDPATDRYVLRNALDWCFITVDDAPLVVRALALPARGAPVLYLSDGSTEPLDPATLRLDGDDVPYCDVRGGTLPARFDRAAAFALLDRATLEDGRVVLELPGGRCALRRVSAGAGAPRRAPAQPET